MAKAAAAALIAAFWVAAVPSVLRAADSFITVASAGTTEGTGGVSLLTFEVTVSPPSAVPLSFDFATADNSATAPADYRAREGTLTIPAGQATATIAISVVPDAVQEPTESMLLMLSNPVHCVLLQTLIAGTILDDDAPAAPQIAVPQASVRRGFSGTRPLNFILTLNKPQPNPVSLRATTADFTAVAGTDYDAVTQVITFQPGETSQIFSVTVHGLSAPTTDKFVRVDFTEATVAAPAYTLGVIAWGDAPVVSLTAPADRTLKTEGGSVTLTATAADPDAGVDHVEFYRGAVLLGTDAASPYSFDWTNLPAGVYSLMARAVSGDHHHTDSTPVTLLVDLPANQVPTVSLTSPVPDPALVAPAALRFSATASDADGSVKKVEFFQGAVKVGEDLSAPYEFSWTDVPAGVYALTAHAVDDTGGVGISPVVTVTVAGAPSGADDGARSVAVSPNPWIARRDAGRPLVFSHLAPGESVRIFARGHLIATLQEQNGAAEWNVGDAPSGAYAFVTGSRHGRFVLVR
jgi:hypothetical protein